MLKMTRESYDGMGEYLFEHWHAGDIEPDDWHADPDTGEGFARFGRRVIVDYENGRSIDYTRHDTMADALEQVDKLHRDRPPCEWDGIVSEDRGRYYVSCEGSRDKREYLSLELATRGLAQAMVDAGCFSDAFYVGERGGYWRIDDEVRAFHDTGGDQMLPEPRIGLTFASDGCAWEVVDAAGDDIDAVAVGDDGHTLFSWADIAGDIIADHDYCGECGQIGCTANC